VKFDGFANSLLRSGKRVAGCDATREIRHVRGIITAGIFDDNA